MPAIRVLLSQMPQILRDILEHAVRGQPDLELIRDGRAAGNGTHDDAAPDVVILGAASSDPARIPMALLARWPEARIMIVTPAEGEAALYELRPHITELGRVSPADLIRRIRETASAPTLR